MSRLNHIASTHSLSLCHQHICRLCFSLYVQSFVISLVFSFSDVFPTIELTSHECKNNTTNNNINSNHDSNSSNQKKNINSNVMINNNLSRNNNSNSVSNGNGDVETSNKLNYKTTISNNKNRNNNIAGNVNDVNSNANAVEAQSKSGFATFDEPITAGTDFFAAFNENFGKNRRNSAHEIVDAFGVGFNLNGATDQERNNNTKERAKSTESSMATNFVHSFAHKFDNFNANKTSDTKLGFDDDDGFADFSAFNATNLTFKSDTSSRSAESETKPKSSPKKLNPIRGSDFEKLNANSTDAGAKIVTKYSVDYSKNDQFDVDLQAALQRSLVEQ